MDHGKNSHYLLGQFTAMVQAMEEANNPTHPQKGDNWGEQVLPLYTANVTGTLEFVGKIISELPPTIHLPQRDCTLTQLKELFDQINVAELEEHLDTALFLKGYKDWINHTVAVPSDDSFNLGAFMGVLQNMEHAAHPKQDSKAYDTAEDIFLLFNMNFDSTMQIAQKVISTLPETALMKGKEFSIQQVKEAYNLLDMNYLAQNPLDKDQFVSGYNSQTPYWHD